jgi:TfoX/Sxy family transcriptional regulator of competence genes
MSQSSIMPEARFAALVEEFLGTPGVTPPAEGRAFGSAGLKVHGRIFAMLVRDQLVVKLPKARVDALVASGAGERFTANRDRPMKEWIAIDPASGEEWLLLAREALAFAAS